MKNKLLIHTGKFDASGDELVVFEGKSDGGDDGWFLGEHYVRTVYYDGSVLPKYHSVTAPMLFFGTDNGFEDAKNAALKTAENYAGYDSANKLVY